MLRLKTDEHGLRKIETRQAALLSALRRKPPHHASLSSVFGQVGRDLSAVSGIDGALGNR